MIKNGIGPIPIAKNPIYTKIDVTNKKERCFTILKLIRIDIIDIRNVDDINNGLRPHLSIKIDDTNVIITLIIDIAKLIRRAWFGNS